MQAHHEPWLTALFNEHLAGGANAARSLVGLPADPHPWSTPAAMQVLVAVIVIVIFAILRPRLSMDQPGVTQHIFELVYKFLHGQAEDQVGHHGPKYLVLFGTLFLFILFSNLLGTIPTFESPTMFPEVPLGCALVAFGYYHVVGMQAHGLGRYLAHFAGPMPWLAPLMVPIELISNLARPLSLTVRLFANMFAGEQVTLVFLQLTFLVVPVAFMTLHLFVAFLQAYVFTLLTMVYVAGATAQEH